MSHSTAGSFSYRRGSGVPTERFPFQDWSPMDRWARTLVIAFSMWAWSAAAQAQGRSGIAVKATGVVKMRPDVLELEGHVSGNAELAGDAITKYRSNRQRAVEAIEALQIPSLKIQAGRIDITAQMDQAAIQAMQRGMPATVSASRPLNVAEPLSIRIDGIDALTNEQIIEMLVKIVDAGKDAGVTLGAKDSPTYNPYTGGYNTSGSAMARFRLSDVESARQKAFEEAMKNAQRQGERLATLSGLKLGKVRAITESPSTPQPQQQVNVVYGFMPPNSEKEAELYTSSSLQEISVSAAIDVEFEVQP
ncbi:MAG: DUF541 domain-containing protein [Planctomycetota bacterium]|nr:MAG: DUF541 domain-containing protein [Planctomycetota bacterium]